MTENGLSVREMTPGDVHIRINYFHGSSDQHLTAMGVDRSRLPDPDRWAADFATDFAQPLENRQGYGVMWETDGEVVGFSTLDQIKPGDLARMHLHVLDPERRKRGLGARFVRLSVQHYIERFNLSSVICEPNTLNTAPNRALQAAGFRFMFSYETVPGQINLHQTVTRWEYRTPKD